MQFPPQGGASQVELVVKNLPVSVGDRSDVGLIPGLGRSPGEGHGNPLQYSCLENPMDRGAWRATAHRVAKSRTWLSTWCTPQGSRGSLELDVGFNSATYFQTLN